jgi:sugar phosphate permease
MSTEALPLLRRGPFAWFTPEPPAATIHTDPDEIRRGYRHWQPRVLTASTVGYAIYYFVRVNLSVAMPAMEKDLHITKTSLGLFLTLHGVVYGISKFLNGFLGDRANARTFMATGLFLSALANIAFGSASLVVPLGIFWLINGYVQGMGFPPCARLLTHWFPPHKLATKMSIWNISHQMGGFLILILCGQLVVHLGWRSCFYIPACIAIITSIYLLIFLRDTPESLGLPPVEMLEGSAIARNPQPEPSHERAVLPHDKNRIKGDTTLYIKGRVPFNSVGERDQNDGRILEYARPAADDELPYGQILLRYVVSNPYIWLVSITNFFVYTIRYAIVSWAPTFLSQQRHIQLTHAAVINACFEFTGMFGALSSGYITDRYFQGRPSRVALFYMIACGVLLYIFYRMQTNSEAICTIVISLLGFTVYGPQCLIGIAAANLATKRAAAASVGLTGLFGYLSTVLSGVGLGYLVDHYGWSAAFLALIFVAGAAVLLFAAAWPAPAVGNRPEI